MAPVQAPDEAVGRPGQVFPAPSDHLLEAGCALGTCPEVVKVLNVLQGVPKCLFTFLFWLEIEMS